MKKYSSIILIISISLVVFGFGTYSQAQEETSIPQAPETLEEAKSMGEKILIGIPKALKGPWQGAVQVWKKMWQGVKNFWNSYIQPPISSFWQKIKYFFRKEKIKKEFEKEKQEMKEEIPKVSKSLWERFKELIK